MSPSSATLRGRLSLVASAVLLAFAAHAQAASPVNVDIAAQPLDKALGVLAQQTGAKIVFSTALTEQRRGTAVRGQVTIEQALQQVLAGTGLVARPNGQGGYTVVAQPAEPASDGATLAPVVVTAQTDRASEGTGSYTARSTNTATGLGLSLRETPQSVSIITRQRMEDQGLTQLTDVAAQTAGLSISQGGNMGSDSSPIYSRGFSVDNYMIDGVKLLGSYSSIFQSQDMALYDRVEIVRGATGLMNGSGTPSAGINLVRKKPTSVFQASARIEAGSWDYRRADVDISAPLNEAGSLRGRVVAAMQDAKSYIDRLNEDRKVFYGVLEADLTPVTVARAGVSHQRHDSTGHARGGLPAYASDGSRLYWDRSDSAAANWAYSRRHSTTAFTELEHMLDNGWELKATLSRTITDSDEVLGYASGGYPNRATGTGAIMYASRWRYKPRQDAIDLSAKGQFSLFGRKHDLAFGATMARSVENHSPNFTGWSPAGWSNAVPDIFNWDGNVPVEPYNPAIGWRDADDRSNSLFASMRLRPTDAFSVIVGSRVIDWRRTTSSHRFATGITTTTRLQESGEVVPYAGLVFDFSEHWSAYASYTTIFQPQTSKTITGEYLPPLLGNSREIGVKGAFFGNRLNIGAALYDTKEDNKAMAIPNVFAPDGSQAYEAQSGTRSRGFELEVAGQLQRNWELTASFARNMSKDRLGARLNTNVPQNTAKLFTTYRLPGVGNGLIIGGGVRWQSDIYTDNLGPLKARFIQPSYAVVDLMARYAITKDLMATVNLYNVFDKTYYTSTGNSYYGAPRAIRVGLEARF